MARKVCEKTYNRDRLRTKKMALQKIKVLGNMSEDEVDAHIQSIFGKEYELEFEDVVNNIVHLDKNIDSVSVLTGIA